MLKSGRDVLESEIDNGKTPTKKNVDGIKTFKGLIALHISDMKEVGKKIGRSKEYSLKLIERHLGEVRLDKLDPDPVRSMPLPHGQFALISQT